MRLPFSAATLAMRESGSTARTFRTGLYQLRRRDARSGFDVECAQITTVNQPKVRERG